MTTRTLNRSVVQQIIDHALDPKEERVSDHLFIPTGSTLLNLALSDRADGGYCLGTMVNVIGDKSSGKTFLCLSTMAEAAHDDRFSGYEGRFDDAEAANRFDMVKLFGQKTADWVKPAIEDNEETNHSRTIQEFQIVSRKLLRRGTPLIYVLDSFDAISSDAEIAYADKAEEAYESGKEIKGTYAMDKAKLASSCLRLINGEIEHSKSLFILISQTRDNIDPMSFTSRTRAGGKALYFYCATEMWIAIEKRLTVVVNDKPRVVGVQSKIKITKNKYNGKEREISLPIFYDIGVDDVGSCVDFLIAEKWWTKSGSGVIDAKELKRNETRAKLIKTIEENDLIPALHRITQKCWLSIEEKLKLDRKPRYT